MAGQRAFRPSVRDSSLEGRLVLSHAGIATEAAKHLQALAHLEAVEDAKEARALERAEALEAAKEARLARLLLAKEHKTGDTVNTSPTPTPTPTFTPTPTPSPTPSPTPTPTPTPTFTPTPTPSPTPSPTPTPTPTTTQPLSSAVMSSSQFNSLFQEVPTAPAMTSGFQFSGSSASGTVTSEVFQGSGAASGLYAYAYQFNVASGAPVTVQGASWLFNATPTASNLTGAGPVYAYVIQDGAVGNLNTPTQSGVGLTWQTGVGAGTVSASFAGLSSGGTSATIIVISNKPPLLQQTANIQASLPNDPDEDFVLVYSPAEGPIVALPSNNS